MYNAPTRTIDAQLEVYFTSTPLIINKSNYLISCELLEELGNDSEGNLIGDVSANELDIQLFNDNGIFSPYNTKSPYYGLMKAGVKVVYKLRATPESDWDEMGTFYVNDWYAEVTGLLASVTCYDKMHSMLSSPAPALPAKRDVKYHDAFVDLLSGTALEYNVDSDIQGTLLWMYCLDTFGSTLKELSKACFVASFCDRQGAVRVLSAYKHRDVLHTITDGEQIISAVVPQSIDRDYNGIKVVLNRAQLSNQSSLLDVKDYRVLPGVHSSGALSFSSAPIAHIESVVVDSNSTKVDLLGFKCTTNTIDVNLRNDGTNDVVASLVVYGRLIETVKSVYNTYGIDTLNFDNVYVQTEQAAKLANSILDKFINNRLPTLKLSIRGNPKILLGDKVKVESNKYNLSFTGILKRAKYTYDGSLKCEVELINSNMLEVL